MISRLAVAALFSCLTFTPTGFAQESHPQSLPPRESSKPSAAWPENYVLNLTTKEDETSIVDLTIMLAGPIVSVQQPAKDPRKEASFSFSGNVQRDANGSLAISYTIEGLHAVFTPLAGADGKAPRETVEYKTSTVRSTIRLNPGEAAEIFRIGNRTWRLSIDRVSAAKE